MNTITVNGTFLTDEYGRQRIFNGINMVNKGEKNKITGEKEYNFTWDEKTFSSLKAKGVNIIRLGVIWDGVEHNIGVYNDEYINKLLNIAKMCEKYGIYFYLDMHQDLYAADYSDGAPEWAVLTDGYKYKEPKVIWAESYYFSKAVHHAIDNFWANKEIDGTGVQDRFIKMWQYVASKFKDCPNLLGFDVYNEPLPGSESTKIVKKLLWGGVDTILLSGKVKRLKAIKNIIKGSIVTDSLAVLDDVNVSKGIIEPCEKILCEFDVKKYYPFLKKVASALREVSDKGIIICENSYYSNIGVPCRTPRLVYDDRRENNLVYAPHAYDLTVDSVYTNTASNARVDNIFAEHKRTQDRLNVPVIVGEWGGMVPGDDKYPHLEHLLELFDKNKWSQTYWTYFDGLCDTEIMRIIARPYPQAVAGEITEYRFDRKTNEFTLKYTSDGKFKAETEIFVPCAVKKITADGKYKIADNKNSTFTVCVKPAKGENTVVISI